MTTTIRQIESFRNSLGPDHGIRALDAVLARVKLLVWYVVQNQRWHCLCLRYAPRRIRSLINGAALEARDECNVETVLKDTPGNGIEESHKISLWLE